jgi:ferrous iron transport protein B
MTITSRTLFRLDYGGKLEREIARIIASFEENKFNTEHYPQRWLAIKLLESDVDILERVQAMPNGIQVIALAQQGAEKIKSMLGDDVDMLTADHRYGYINGVVRQALHRPSIDRITLTDRVDDIVTHKWFGLPFFFAIMYVMFRLVIDVSAPFLDWTDAVINGPIAHWFASLLNLVLAPAWIHSLIIDGIVAGVGGVLVFVPGLLILYFFLALLEDSGYMSRAAFVMDRFMRVVGLHGKSFIPMILGFGCVARPVDVVLGAPACLRGVWSGVLRLSRRDGYLGHVCAGYSDRHVERHGLHPYFTETRCFIRLCAGTTSLSPACAEKCVDPHVGEHA